MVFARKMVKADVIMPIAKAKIVSIVNMDIVRLRIAEIASMVTAIYALKKKVNKLSYLHTIKMFHNALGANICTDKTTYT